MHTPRRFGPPAGIAVVVAAAAILSGPASAHAQDDARADASGGTVTLTGVAITITPAEEPEHIVELPDPSRPAPSAPASPPTAPVPDLPVLERPGADLPPVFVPERPSPSAPEPEPPVLETPTPETPRPEGPGEAPTIPAQPDAELPAQPEPEVPQRPDPEVPQRPEPEVPQHPEPELPEHTEPEAPELPAPENPAAPIPPATPDGLVGHADPDGAVVLAWDDAGEGTEYRVERSVDGGLPELLGDTLLPRFRDETVLVPGVYVYRVSAINADGEPSGGFAEVSLRIEDAGEAPVSSPGATTEIGVRSDVRTMPVRERGTYRD